MDFRKWIEAFDTSLDVPDAGVELPRRGVPAAGALDESEGTVIGNLGSKVVGTLIGWVSEPDGFFVRVKNPDVLEEGVNRMRSAIQAFNRRANRMVSSSVTKTKELREIQSPWFFTVGARLGDLLKRGTDPERALSQLQVLAPKLERKWSEFLAENELGIRVTDPSVIDEPVGADVSGG